MKFIDLRKIHVWKHERDPLLNVQMFEMFVKMSSTSGVSLGSSLPKMSKRSLELIVFSSADATSKLPLSCGVVSSFEGAVKVDIGSNFGFFSVGSLLILLKVSASTVDISFLFFVGYLFQTCAQLWL